MNEGTCHLCGGSDKDNFHHPGCPELAQSVLTSGGATSDRPLTERLRSGFGGLVPPVCDEAANKIESLTFKLNEFEKLVTVEPGTVSEDVNALRNFLRKSMYLTRKANERADAAESRLNSIRDVECHRCGHRADALSPEIGQGSEA